MVLVKYLTDNHIIVYSRIHSSILTIHNDDLVNVPQIELDLPVKLER